MAMPSNYAIQGIAIMLNTITSGQVKTWNYEMQHRRYCIAAPPLY